VTRTPQAQGGTIECNTLACVTAEERSDPRSPAQAVRVNVTATTRNSTVVNAAHAGLTRRPEYLVLRQEQGLREEGQLELNGREQQFIKTSPADRQRSPSSSPGACPPPASAERAGREPGCSERHSEQQRQPAIKGKGKRL